ncbi:hypothetical protein F7725_021044, partial [Dissostichus mawsoni]
MSHQDFRCKYKLQFLPLYHTFDIDYPKCIYLRKGLMFTPWCLDYWVDPSDPDQAVLTIGDIGGQVSALYFTSAQISLFERLNVRTDSDSADIFQWDELVRGKHRSCYTVTHRAHTPAWVRKVRYLGSLEAFVSCSTRPQSSVVIGWREKESRSLRVTSFFTKRGVWDMDHHRELNLIGRATTDQLLKDKTQEDTHTLLFLHEEQHLLFLSFNSLLLLLERKEEEKRSSSHEHPVTCVLYNSLFRQFRRCHGNAEISTMALDGTQTRLFTAGADGEVKVWDFNGRCLHRMNAGLGRSVDISQVLLLRRSSYVEPSEWKGGVQHRSDVLCAAFQPPQTLVT